MRRATLDGWWRLASWASLRQPARLSYEVSGKMASYRKTPLSEAIFEFAPEATSFPPEGAERLVRLFSAGFPKLQELPGIEVEFEVSPAGVSPKRDGKKTVRHRLWNLANSRLLQFAPDMCAFNALPPYTHYVDYLPDIERLFTAYLGEAKPSALRFLGQRYINRIFLPSEAANPSDYFTFYPRRPAAHHPPFSLQLETERLSQGQVVLSLYYAGLDSQRPLYFLDLYARSSENPGIAFDWLVAKAWQDEAHEGITRAFEHAITDTSRQLLERED